MIINYQLKQSKKNKLNTLQEQNMETRLMYILVMKTPSFGFKILFKKEE